LHGVSGTRTAISRVVVAKGVVSGVGHVAGLPDLPTDPGNVSGDDLVFRGGTMHIVTTNLSASFSVHLHDCLSSGTLQQTGRVIGRTGQPYAGVRRRRVRLCSPGDQPGIIHHRARKFTT
jgi:hypothetical protein